jgi:DnaJ-class molecular chaperone
MTSAYERLGVTLGASAAEIKAAYHRQLKAFPAHSHPQEFKAIRQAYETLRKDLAQQARDFFEPRPFDLSIEPELVQKLSVRLGDRLKMTLPELLKQTF